MKMTATIEPGSDEAREKQATESRKALVKSLTDRLKNAETFWKPTFERIAEDIRFAGGDQWQDAEEKMADSASDKYQVNFVQRELNQQVSAIYAKNPTVKCDRRKRMEYVVWDGTDVQLRGAQMVLQANAQALQLADQAKQMLAAADKVQQENPGVPLPPEGENALMQARQHLAIIPPEVVTAQQVMQDYMAGVARKTLYDKIGQTAELLISHQLDMQEPDFESQMKGLILREKVTGAGFVAVKFQRINESVATASATRATVIDRLQRIQQMAEEAAEDDLTEAQKEEYRLELAALQTALQDQQTVREEGLVLDFKPTTSILVDPKCRNLFKFLGADWVAEILNWSPEQIEAQWGVDVRSTAVSYQHGVECKNQTNLNTKAGGAKDRDNAVSGNWPEQATARVWIVYDKAAQLQYTICDGHDDFLEEPTAPWPAVKGFWPIVALKLSLAEVEENNPKAGITIYGQSVVRLLKPMQEELNRTQEALRQHRIANKPGHICGKDTFDENDRQALANREAHDVIALNNIPPAGDVTKVLVSIPTVPIDPALYRTDGVMQQAMLVTGSQQANLGQQAAGEKATGQAIAEQSRVVGASSEVDSLDKFLTEIVRIGGEMAFKEMTLDTVKSIVGPGAAWPNDPKNRQTINETLYLKIEAGSMGRPNRAMEINNLERLLPQLQALAMALNLPLGPLLKYAAKVMEFGFDVDEWLASALQQPGAAPAGPGQPGQPGQPPQNGQPAGGQSAGPANNQPQPNQQTPPVPGGGLPRAMLTKAQHAS